MKTHIYVFQVWKPQHDLIMNFSPADI